MKLPDDFTGDFDEMPKDWMPENLCTHESLKSIIEEVFPTVNTDDTSWMTLNDKTYSIEFNVGDADPITTITLHVRGNDEALQSIRNISEKLNCKAFDTTEGEIINFSEKPNKGFLKWRNYRDKVCK